jgi:hypothetical protein
MTKREIKVREPFFLSDTPPFLLADGAVPQTEKRLHEISHSPKDRLGITSSFLLYFILNPYDFTVNEQRHPWT